ncbi:hypothetical protein ACJX0J_036140 [Zea mays]
MTTEQADQEVVVLKIKISVKWQSSDSERKGMWKKQLSSSFNLLFRFVNKSLKGPDLSLLLVTLAVINRVERINQFLHVWSFVWIQSAKPTLLTILCALANWARLLTDWINRISKLSSYDFRLISLLIEYLDKQAQNKELRQLYQRWTNRISYSWNDGKDYLFPFSSMAPLATFFPLVPYLCSAFNNKTFALNCFSKDLHWANLNLFTSLLFETTPPLFQNSIHAQKAHFFLNSFDNTGLTDLGWKFAGTLWACKDKVDISSIGIERTWFMEITFLQLDLFKNGMQVTYRRLKVERIGGGHFHFNVAVGKYSFTKLEYDRVLFLALVNAQYLFNEEMNNRKSTILQIENVWCQRI